MITERSLHPNAACSIFTISYVNQVELRVIHEGARAAEKARQKHSFQDFLFAPKIKT